MSFTIKAPYPGVQTTTILPSPQWGNSEGRVQDINIKRSISGEVRTYVTRGTMPNGHPRSKMQWQFILTRNKAIELLEFTKSYHSSMVQIFDHVDREYRGYIMNNPLEITPVRRGAPNVQDMPRGELCEVTLEFEGEAFLPPKPPVKYSASATSVIETLSSGVNLLPAFPGSVYGIKYYWDAWDLTGYSQGDRISTWPANALASQQVALEKHPSGRFNYKVYVPSGLDHSPYYVRDVMGPGMPSAYFGSVAGGGVLSTAGMRSAADVNFWPGKKGTVFFVSQHTIGQPAGTVNRFFQSSTEFCQWAIRRSSDYRPMDSFNICGGGAGWWAPATWRSTGSSGDKGSDGGWEHPTLNAENPTSGTYIYPSTLARGRPYIHMIQRNNSQIRYRANSLEFPGRTILNYPPTQGRFTYTIDASSLTNYTATAYGCLGEFMVWDRILSEEEIEKVEKYLSEKWAIPLEFWDYTDDCAPDWCLSFAQWCSGTTITYLPNFTGTATVDYPAAGIVKGTRPVYKNTCPCCEEE